MFDKIDLSLKISKRDYKDEVKKLSNELSRLQQKIKELNIPVIVAFEGWSASGKGTSIARLVYPLDPRNFKVHTMAKVTEDIIMHPALWNYWAKTPEKGKIAIFDKSWQRAALAEADGKFKLKQKERDNFFYDSNAFEKALADDGAVILKFFLHISQGEQKKRFKAIEKNEDTAWRVDKDDWQQNKEYNKHLKIFENMIKATDSEYGKWHIVEANDTRYAAVKVYRTIIDTLNNVIKEREGAQEIREASMPPSDIDMLGSYEPSAVMTDDEYDKKLNYYQERLSELGFKLYAKRRPVVIVYEGWDAAGKGGNIKRLTEELDPRGYEVIPISAPDRQELAHHYLWRFWTKMPKDGHFGIFDRSWYGRVMVERVERFTPAHVWQRAYKEINDMELHMHHHGAIILKFWLNIDKEEQLRRFEARQNDPLKQYKITDEDWRNREKWDMYYSAVNDMLNKTSTDYAPWHIIESNDKKFARIKVLKKVVDELTKELGD